MAKLLGIRKGQGNCEHCSRELTARLFTVETDNGQTVQLGRRCAAKATGYKVNQVEQEARRIVRMAETARRRQIISAEYPTLSDDQVREIAVDDWMWNSGEWHTAATNWSA